MCFAHVEYALRLTDPALRPAEKLVLVTVFEALRSNDSAAGSWMSNSSISSRVGITVRNVQMILLRLIELRLLERIERPGMTSILRPGGDVRIAPTRDASITPGVMSASPLDPEGAMHASGGGRCLHQGGGDVCITQTGIEPEDEPEPPHIHPLSMTDEAERSGCGGGGDFSIEDQDRETTRRRLIDWWSNEVALLDDRIRPLRIVTDEMLDLFNLRRESFPNVLEDLPRALDPLAGWITTRLSFETFFRSASSLDAALGGRFREANTRKASRLIEERKERDKRAREARALENARRFRRPPRVTNETIENVAL